jgi:uncharacterized OB-fold protein
MTRLTSDMKLKAEYHDCDNYRKRNHIQLYPERCPRCGKNKSTTIIVCWTCFRELQKEYAHHMKILVAVRETLKRSNCTL